MLEMMDVVAGGAAEDDMVLAGVLRGSSCRAPAVFGVVADHQRREIAVRRSDRPPSAPRPR